MNIKEWQRACEEGYATRRYDNASREIQLSLKYNHDPNATVRHHLRDTEEQRKYNDEHYELWGFEIDEDGNEHFEYGKYIVFLTPEEHAKVHSCSKETRKKLSEAAKNQWQDEEIRSVMIASRVGRRHTEETKQKCRESKLGEKNPMYGVHNTGEKAPMYGKKHSDETKGRMKEIHSTQMKAVSLAYKEHKENGGKLSWNEFQIYYNKVIK